MCNCESWYDVVFSEIILGDRVTVYECATCKSQHLSVNGDDVTTLDFAEWLYKGIEPLPVI